MSALKTYGELLREARQAKDMVLEQVAAALALSVTYVGEVERGRKNPLDAASTVRWANLVGLPWEQALDARARYHEQSTLQLGLRPDQDEAALLLSRRWASYSRDQIRRIVEAAS